MLPCLFLLASCLVVAGCGEENWGYVDGTVRLDGKPVGPAIISFKPVDPSAPGGGVGQVDANGHYTIRSSGRKEGLAAGEYIILIKPGTLGRGEDEEASNAASTIPNKYLQPASSGLLRTVEPKAQTHDFNLES